MLNIKSSFASLLAAVSAAFASTNPTSGLYPVGELPAPKQTYRGATPMKRTRIKGKPGNSGDKLARKAAEGTVGKAYLR